MVGIEPVHPVDRALLNWGILIEAPPETGVRRHLAMESMEATGPPAASFSNSWMYFSSGLGVFSTDSKIFLRPVMA
jgi:hypothetical protein